MSNANHYPSIELCRKLTEIGFPKTYEMTIDENGDFKTVYPSVMEMLDVMPKRIETGKNIFWWFGIIMNGPDYLVSYDDENMEIMIHKVSKPLPNALAEMILWLVDNGYINFNDS